jgi:hypothetical protein
LQLKLTRLAIALAFILVTSPSVIAATAYATYHNARFSYSIAYPQTLLLPQGEADNGDGQVFASQTGDASLRVYGTNFDKSSTDLYPNIEDAFHEAATEKAGKAIIYKRLKNNWFVVSGLIDNKIFYQKTVYGNQQTCTLYLEYPKNQQKTYDAITKHIANSLKISK